MDPDLTDEERAELEAIELERQPLVVTGGSRYALTNADGLVENVILWDGTTPLEVDGTLVPLPDDSPIGPGDTIAATAAGEFEATAKAEPVEVEPTIEDRVAALERGRLDQDGEIHAP